MFNSLEEAYVNLLSEDTRTNGFFALKSGYYVDLRELKSALDQQVHIYSGSFNPLHDGHISVFNAIAIRDKFFEVSLQRRDKEFLKYKELEARLEQFKGRYDVLVLNKPTYAEKIKIIKHPELFFHIGIDTARRLIEDDGIKKIEKMKADFIVYSRMIDGVLRTWRNIEFKPKNFHEGLTPDEKLLAVNSTDLRNNAIKREK